MDKENIAAKLQAQTDWVRENWPKETAHILRIAQEVCNQYFLFDLPWDMERTYEPVIFEGEINWEYQPGADIEFIYQMNRHRYFICLGQAYVITGDEKYAQCFVRLLTDWIHRVPLTLKTEKTTWRTIEAGLRGTYWTKAFPYFINSPFLTQGVRREYLECLEIHGDYLMRNFTGFKHSSNWGVLESQGLYLIGQELRNAEFSKMAIKRLTLVAGIQILCDGVHWEQSAMYHNEVLVCYLEVLREQKARGEKLSEQLLETVNKMAMVDLAWIKPDHSQPLYGDSDQTDIRDILTHSAYLLFEGGMVEEASQLKAGGYTKMDFDGCFDFGMNGVCVYEELQAGTVNLDAVSLYDSGNYILRSGFFEEADYLHFCNGSHGGGHGHSDKLHISLVWDGEDVLTDAGRYTYVDGVDRIWFKSAQAHNTIVVDGMDYVAYNGPWGIAGGISEVRMPMQKRDGYVLLEGANIGYIMESTKPMNVYLNRKILLLEEGLLLILDTAVTSEEHEYSRFFHLKEKHGLSRNKDGFHYRGEKTEGRIWIDSYSEKKEIASKWSGHYNEYSENTCLAAYTQGKGLTTMCAVFSKGRENITVKEKDVWSQVSEEYLDRSCAAAWNVCRGEESIDVILRILDGEGTTALLQSGACMGMGRIMVAKEGEKTTVFF